MSKIGKRGFLLAETIIVTVVISTILIVLYISINRLSSAYQNRDKYYNSDALYFTKEVNNIIHLSDIIDTIEVNDFYVINSDIIPQLITIYDKLDYSIVNAYYVKYNEEVLDNFMGDEYSLTMHDYITYLQSKTDFDEGYNYFILGELCKDTDDCYYYALAQK